MNNMQDEDLANVMRALGHPVRLSILRILAEKQASACCCTDVTQCLPLAQSTVSQHIKVLLDSGSMLRLDGYSRRSSSTPAVGRQRATTPPRPVAWASH